MSVHGRTVCITGSSSGMGRAIAEHLGALGATVYLMGNHEHRALALQHSSGSALVRDYCADLYARIKTAAKSCGAKTILDYHAEKGVYRLGPVAFVHGYAHGLNATAEQGKHYADRGGA
ncbi:MAG: SDR family NAD(P)-dependent oxidoreductase, partial [Actinobacteria bacterium]|nr:SDR family NAD(P)-dependent oxidoreductase [Actinomycetota bacterium]